MAQMSQAARVLGKFPSLAALQRELGHVNGSTISSWRQRGFIPAQQQQLVLDAAQRMGVAVTPQDFFDPPAPEGAATEAAA